MVEFKVIEDYEFTEEELAEAVPITEEEFRKKCEEEGNVIIETPTGLVCATVIDDSDLYETIEIEKEAAWLAKETGEAEEE